MRLSQKEISALLTSFKSHLQTIPYEVSLFGSRTDDHKRGGDIDLLLKVAPEHFEYVRSIKVILKFDLEEAVGDQRVDLTIATEETLKNDIFLQSISPELVKLR